MNDQRRQDRHDKKLLQLGVSDPRCADCEYDRIPALRLLGDRTIKCANCKRGYAPLSAVAARRKLAKFAAAGFPQPACINCGLDCLRLLNLHHIACAANSDLTVPLCENCHAVVSDSQEDLPLNPDLRLYDANRDPHLRQAAILEGLAIFFGALMITFLLWAAWNRGAAADLAAAYGSEYWRVITAVVPQ
jgi:hypothetical protein